MIFSGLAATVCEFCCDGGDGGVGAIGGAHGVVESGDDGGDFPGFVFLHFGGGDGGPLFAVFALKGDVFTCCEITTSDH